MIFFKCQSHNITIVNTRNLLDAMHSVTEPQIHKIICSGNTFIDATLQIIPPNGA